MAGIAFWLAVAIVCLAPLPFGSNRPWSSNAIVLLAGVALVLFAGAALRDRSEIRVEIRRYFVPASLFGAALVWFAIQSSAAAPGQWHHPLWKDMAAALDGPVDGAVSLDPEATRTIFLRLLAYASLFWLIMQQGRDPRRALQMFSAVAIAGTAYAAYGLIVQLSGSKSILWFDKWSYADVVTSTFVNRNSYATYAGLTLLTVGALLVREFYRAAPVDALHVAGILQFTENLRKRGVALMIAGLLVSTALLLTQSRGGFISTTIGLGTLLALIMFRRRRRFGSWLFLAAAAGLMGLAVMQAAGAGLAARLAHTAADQYAPDTRRAINDVTLSALADAPGGGTGLGTYPSLFQLYRGTRFPVYSAAFDHAHNTYLELALEGGPLALASMLAAIGYVAAVSLLGALRRRGRFIYPAAGVAATVLVGVHALADFSLEIPGVAVTYAALLATGFGQSWRLSQVERRIATGR